MTNEIGKKLEEKLRIAGDKAREAESELKAEAEIKIKSAWEEWRALNKKATGWWCRGQMVKEMMQYSDFRLKRETQPHQYQISDKMPYCGQVMGENPQEDPVVEILYELGVRRDETLKDLSEKKDIKSQCNLRNILKRLVIEA